jgi:excisionase family DNA binding protein
MKQTDADELLSPKEVARLMKLSVGHVRDLADAGRIPVLKTRNGRRLFRRADVEEAIRVREGRGSAPVKEPRARSDSELVGVVKVLDHCHFIWRGKNGIRIVETQTEHCEQCLEELSRSGFAQGNPQTAMSRSE